MPRTTLRGNACDNGPSRTVGSVYGRAVTSADIGLTGAIEPGVQFDPRDTARWELMGRVMTAFGKPVVDRFVEQHKVDATADEIAAFKKTSQKMNEGHVRETEERLAKLKAELASPNLPAEDKAKLEKTRAMLERILPGIRETAKDGAPEAIARTFIVAWKTERELQRTYGGRVIFQQAGPEALDARRLLFEAAEKSGDLKFDDPAVRRMFYYYSRMEHPVVDAKALEYPWFLVEPGTGKMEN